VWANSRSLLCLFALALASILAFALAFALVRTRAPFTPYTFVPPRIVVSQLLLTFPNVY
jgi:hypothetical protein